MECTRHLRSTGAGRRLAALLVIAGLAAATAACAGRRGTTIDASDLPQPGSEAAAQANAGAGAAPAGQGEVTGRALGGAPTAAGPGRTPGAPGDAGQPAAPGQQLALGPTVQTPAGPVQEVEALRDIYFAFDSYTLDDRAKETLAYNANWMQRYPTTKILIEGHTDERGSVAYNLALGERRAVAARDYLVTLGVARQRLSTISYGKERPVDPRHTEEAWAKNRRAHFVVVSQ